MTVKKPFHHLLKMTGRWLPPCVAILAMPVVAQEIHIESLAGNGVLTWTNSPVERAAFRVEWAPSLDANWQDSWDSLEKIPATNDVTQRPVPMFYRVVMYTPPAQAITDVPATAAFTVLTNRFEDSDFIVLDVRTPNEYAAGHVKTALSVNFYSTAFQQTLAKLDPDQTYLVYCASGNRSRQATEVLHQLKFMDVFNMTEGFSTLASQPGASVYIE